MAVRNVKREELNRLECKTLDAQFKSTIVEGLNCSPFEAQAALEVVHEVYGPAMGRGDGGGLPGQVTLVAVDAEEPAGKPVAECAKRTVRLRVHRAARMIAVYKRRAPMPSGGRAWRISARRRSARGPC